jgi:release factor glutamine methyltransferase
VVTCNAPYVPTAAVASLPREARDHEPVATLDGGPDGLSVIARVLADACGGLAPHGTLLVEVAESQVAAATTLATRAGLPSYVRRRRETGSVVLLASRGRPVSLPAAAR